MEWNVHSGGRPSDSLKALRFASLRGGVRLEKRTSAKLYSVHHAGFSGFFERLFTTWPRRAHSCRTTFETAKLEPDSTYSLFVVLALLAGPSVASLSMKRWLLQTNNLKVQASKPHAAGKVETNHRGSAKLHTTTKKIQSDQHKTA